MAFFMEHVKKMPNKREERLLIFDGECRLCLSAKKFLEKYGRQDGIHFIPYKSLEASQALSQEYKEGERPPCAYLIQKNGVVKRGVEAFFPLMPHGKMRTCLKMLWKSPRIQSLFHWLYHVVACHRYQWFGAFTPSSSSQLRVKKEGETEVATFDPESSDL